MRTTQLLLAVLAGSCSLARAAEAPATPAPPAPAVEPAVPAAAASGLRRFALRDGRMLYAIIESKADTSVTFRLQNGRTEAVPIGMLSEVDQQFVRKWTKFKDELLRNAEFSQLNLKEMLELRGYQTFEFDIEGNHIFVEGELNGKPEKFLIDTGAQSSLIHLKAAEDAKLEIGPMSEKIYGVAGEAPAAVTKVPVLKMGDAVLKNRKLLAADIFKDIGGVQTYGAIFGADFLRELNAAISYREGRMFLWIPEENREPAAGEGAAPKPAEAGAQAGKAAIRQEFRRWTSADGKTMFAALEDKTGTEAVFRMQNGARAKVPFDKLSEEDRAVIAKWSKLRDNLAVNPEFQRLTMRELLELRGYQAFPYRPSGNHILVDGEVNGTKARFLIDTGAHGGVFNLAFAEKAKIEMGPMDQWVYGIGGKAPAANCKIATLKMGDAVIENRTMLVTDLERQQKAFGSSHDGIFGADFLRELDAVISYKEGLMFLRPQLSDRPVEQKGEAAAPAATNG